jgi:hypothetical protein
MMGHEKIVRRNEEAFRHADYVTVSPRTSMAALIYNTEINENSFLLHHSDGTITTPAEWKGPEEVVGMVNAEEYVEFCFAQSSGLARFPSMSILLLKDQGSYGTFYCNHPVAVIVQDQQNQYPLFYKHCSQCFTMFPRIFDQQFQLHKVASFTFGFLSSSKIIFNKLTTYFKLALPAD